MDFGVIARWVDTLRDQATAFQEMERLFAPGATAMEPGRQRMAVSTDQSH